MQRLFRISFFAIFICFCSCNRNTIDLLDIRPNTEETENVDGLEYATCSTESYDIHIGFVEDAIEHFVFHFILQNYTKDSVQISYKDFEIDYSDRFEDSRQRVRAIDATDRIEFLLVEKDNLEREKKQRTLGNAIVAGLQAIAIAVSPGGDVAGAILFAAESGVYIAEDRNAFNVAELSIDDHIKYIEDWVLHKDVLGAESDIEFDLLFERILRNLDFVISADIDGEYCEVEFWQRVQSSRNR